MNPARETFFVSYCKPHACVSAKTLSRWTVVLLSAAGIDTTVWAPHATRSAAALHHRKQLSCIELHRLADWSLASGVFKMFYERYI